MGARPSLCRSFRKSSTWILLRRPSRRSKRDSGEEERDQAWRFRCCHAYLARVAESKSADGEVKAVKAAVLKRIAELHRQVALETKSFLLVNLDLGQGSVHSLIESSSAVLYCEEPTSAEDPVENGTGATAVSSQGKRISSHGSPDERRDGCTKNELNSVKNASKTEVPTNVASRATLLDGSCAAH